MFFIKLMKFRNILFTPFIFLLTGCVNNVSVSTEVGESYYVPKETVFVSFFDNEDFLKSYENSIETIKVSKTKAANEWLKRYEGNKKRFKECLATINAKDCKIIYKPEQREMEYKGNYKSIINEMDITLNSMNTILETFKKEGLKGKHWVKIRYKPVFKDLNGNKRPLRTIETACYNPKLKKEIKEIWKDLEKYNSMLYKDVLAGINLETKLCDKYAKF